MVHKVPEEESRAGGRDLLYDQASKLSGRFGLLADAEYTPNFFLKLSEGSEIFGSFRKILKIFDH